MSTRNLLWLLVCIAGVSIVLVIGIYVHIFAPDFSASLSRDGEQWAWFGEYVGGTLGPTFALLAFGGVLYTIREQRAQSELQEFQKQMSILSVRIESLLSEGPAEANPAEYEKIQQLGVSLSVFSLLASIGNQELKGADPDPQVQRSREERRRLVIAGIRRQGAVIQIELQHLVWCLQEFEAMGGSGRLARLYLRRYQPVVCWLYVLDVLTSEPVSVYFKPEEFSTALRDTPTS